MLTVGDGLGVDVALLVPDVVGLGVGVADVLGVAAVDEPSSSTGRKRSCAVVLTRLITCCDPAPGTVTVMSLAPCCCTLTPLVPDELTRL